MPKPLRRDGESLLNKVTCGDCLDLMKRLPSGSVDLIVTDPPYGINFKSNRQLIKRKGGTRDEPYFDRIANDDVLPVEWLPEAYRVLRDGTALYVFCHWSFFGQLSAAVSVAGFKVKNMIVMYKSRGGMGDLKGGYSPRHELVLFASKGRHVMNYPKRPCDVMECKATFTSAIKPHPNYKPTHWLLPFIENSSQEGQLVLDPYCGSGTTLEAAAQLCRQYVGFDIDPQYAQLANERLQAA